MSLPVIPHPDLAADAAAQPSAQELADARDFAAFAAGQDPLDVAAAEWWVRRQDGLTAEEQAELDAWLAANPAHPPALAQLDGVWGRLDELPDVGVESLKAGLVPQAVAPALPASAPVPEPAVTASPPHTSPPPSVPARRRWWGDLVPQLALAGLAAVVVGGGWYGWTTWQGQPVFEQALLTARGELREATLPDGSQLWLDTATQVAVALYPTRREVRLDEGQVLLDVQPNAEQPFEVLAGKTRITVVGTRFAVRHTRQGLGDEGSVSVGVEEGRVRVANGALLGLGQTVTLVAGQSVTVDAAGALGSVRSAAVSPAAWREGRVSFNGTPLGQALAEFERYGDTGLVIRDPAVAALRVQGSFDLQQVAAFARALPRVLPVQLRPQGGTTEIVAAPP